MDAAPEGWAGREIELPHGSFYVILGCDISRLSGIVHAYAHVAFVITCFVFLLSLIFGELR